MRQELGYFVVIDPDGGKRLVLVSQDISTDEKNVVLSAHKTFTLDTANGEEVFCCSEQRSYIKKDDQVLRVVGHFMTKESDLLHNRML